MTGCHQLDDSKGVVTGLVTRAQGGDQEAEDQLFRHLYTKYMVIANAILGHFHDAEDAVQLALCSVLRHLDKVRSQENPEAYFAAVCRSRCIDVMRRRKSSKTSVFSDRSGITESLLLTTGAIESETCVQREYAAWVWNTASSMLEEKDQRLFALHFQDGLPWKEVAARMGMSVGGTHTRFTRCCQRLRQRFEEDEIHTVD